MRLLVLRSQVLRLPQIKLTLSAYAAVVDTKSCYAFPSFVEHLQEGHAAASDADVARLTTRMKLRALPETWLRDADGAPVLRHGASVVALTELLKAPAEAMEQLRDVARAVSRADTPKAVLAACAPVPVIIARSCVGHEDGARVVVCVTSTPLDDVVTGKGSYERVARAVLRAGGDRAAVGVGVRVFACLTRLRRMRERRVGAGRAR